MLIVREHLIICWGKAILTINYIINKVPHKKLEKIPCEFEKVENLLINTSKCKGVLQR